jgi:hypothetical protein
MAEEIRDGDWVADRVLAALGPEETPEETEAETESKSTFPFLTTRIN